MNGPLRSRPGDDLHWAAPGDNDSGWILDQAGDSHTGDPGGLSWFRLRLLLPGDDRDYAMLLPPIHDAYQVFVNGKLSRTVGELPPHPRAERALPALVDLGSGVAGAPRAVVVAIRTWREPDEGQSRSFRLDGPLAIGRADLLQTRIAGSRAASRWASSGWITLSFFFSVSAAIAFVLYLIDGHNGPAGIWYACLCAAQGALYFLRWWELLHTYPVHLFASAEAGLFFLFLLTLPRFYNRQLQRKGRWGPRLEVLSAALWLMCSFPLAALPGPAIAARAGVQLLLAGVVFVSVISFVISKSLQRDIQARILVVPLLLWCGTMLLDQGLFVAETAGSTAAASVLAHLRVTLPVPLRVEDLAAIVFMLALPLLPIYRFTHTLDEGQRVTTELETARSVQRALVPEEVPAVPGLTIATAYHPAQEVGGDFFQVLALASGATLIVVGDVSGKGMPAALAVSLVIGTLRTVADYTESPGEILTGLNRRAKAHANSFTTCLVLQISADCGRLTYANAGHLAPYLNGTELVSEPSLPLGLLSEETFAERTCTLHPGDHLVLLTDGVPEATRDGQLFGFERTLALSGEGAASIASAARLYGQADDITVLTVEVGTAVPIPAAADALALRA